jgi:hypothetical protein
LPLTGIRVAQRVKAANKPTASVTRPKVEDGMDDEIPF